MRVPPRRKIVGSLDLSSRHSPIFLKGEGRFILADVEEAELGARRRSIRRAQLPAVKNSDCVQLIAEKIAKKLEKPFLVETLSLNIGATVGVARYPLDGLDMSALLRHADEDLDCKMPAGLR